MVAAPKYDSPEVMPSGKPARYIDVDTSADTFGAGVGRAIEGLGATVTQVAGVFDANAEKLRKEAAAAAANQAYVTAATAANEAEATYVTTMGSNAANGYKPFLDNLKTIRQKALDSLEDDEAKKLFDKDFTSNMLSGMNTGARHAAQQGKAAAVDSAQARIDLVMNDSATKFADEGLFQRNLLTLQSQVVEQAGLLGWSPEVTAGKLHTLESLAWESRITSMAASDPEGAKKTFDRMRDDMTVESRLRVQNTVINALHTTASAQGQRFLMAGENVDVRPELREGIIQGGRNHAADQFLLSRAVGKAPDHILGMHPVTADRLAALINAAPPGIRENITIFSGHRTLEHQAELYRRSGGSGMVARPTPGAPHVRGDAADLGWKGGSFKSMPAFARDWLHANAEAFGLTFRLGNEPWHIERLSGPRRAPGMEQGSFVSRIMAAEGGGAGVYSPAGAVGLMQVMPDTAFDVAMSLGIPFDRHRLAHDDQYNLLIGTTYLNQMLNMYNGNEMLAAAAYNAGPGAVNKWLAEIGDPRLGQISNEEFAARIPYAETRGYVEKVMSAAGPYTPRQVTANMTQSEFNVVLEQGRAYAQMMAPGDVIYEERFLDGMRSQYATMVQAQKDAIAANYDSILEAVITAGPDGKYPEQGMFNAALQSDPELAQRWDSLSATNKKTIQDQLRTNANHNKGETGDTDAQLARYDYYIGLWGNPATNKEFKEADIARDPELSQAQKKELINRKGQNPPSAGSTTPVDINMSKALRIAGPILAALEEPFGLKSKRQSDRELYAQFEGALRRVLNEETALKRRQLTDVEMEGVIQQLLMKVMVERPGITLFGDWSPFVSRQEGFAFEDPDFVGSFVGAEPTAPTFTYEVPADARRAIIEQYTQINGVAPTEAVIISIYHSAMQQAQ